MNRISLKFAAVVITASLFACKNGNNKIAAVKLIPVKSGGAFEYIDQEGKIIINPQFGDATIFRDGLALVQTESNDPKWGYVGEDGKFVINAAYKYATIFSDGMAWVVAENGPPTAINTSGEIKITLQDAKKVKIFQEGLAAFSVAGPEGEKWGFVDKSGNIKINPQFTNTGNFSDGKCAVQNSDGKWGYVDAQGKLLINYQFDYAKDFTFNKAIVFVNQKAGLIDDNGKFAINPQFSSMIDDEDIYLIQVDNKYGWCDRDGKFVINPQFSFAYRFSGHEITAVQSGKTYGYVDRNGKITINPQFDMAYPFNGRLAPVRSGGKVGFINVEGKYIINPQFDDLSYDFLTHLVSGNSSYNEVISDYFNMGAIIERISKDISEQGVSGVNFSTPIKTIFEKFHIPDNPDTYFTDFNQSIRLITADNISNDATLDLVMNVAPSTPSPEIASFSYIVTLKRNAFSKTDAIFNALESAFVGFMKDDKRSHPNYTVLKGKNLAITLTKSVGRLELNMQTLQSQNLLEQIPGE